MNIHYRDWEKDPDLPETVQLEPEDYKSVSKAGYDRGHQAPLATFLRVKITIRAI